jgi:hypothetical protein
MASTEINSLVCKSPREIFLKQDDAFERIFEGDNASHGIFASVSFIKFSMSLSMKFFNVLIFANDMSFVSYFRMYLQKTVGAMTQCLHLLFFHR